MYKDSFTMAELARLHFKAKIFVHPKSKSRSDSDQTFTN